jgi:hypothetical protein
MAIGVEDDDAAEVDVASTRRRIQSWRSAAGALVAPTFERPARRAK